MARLTKKQKEAAADAALERLAAGELYPCTLPMVAPCEPCVSGDTILMCHFVGGHPCRSCGAAQPGGEGCFSVGLVRDGH